MNSLFQRIKFAPLLSALFMVVLLSTMFLSLVHMTSGMDMSGGMSDCPLMLDKAVLCQMDVSDHLTSWKAMFLATPLNLILLLLVSIVGVIAISCSVLFGQLLPVWEIPLKNILKESSTNYTVRPLQELFSNGILHPKLYKVFLG